jgi:hypothetical protein
VTDVAQTIHAYPTYGEGPARAAEQWWNHRVLTPRARHVVRPLLAMLRALDHPQSGR